VTLTYGLWDDSQKPAMQQIINEFHASHPKINVKIQLTPFDSYWTKLQTAVTAGTAPDVFWMNTASAQLYALNGAILDLDDQIKSSHLDMNNYVDSIRRAYTVDGKVYAIPKDVNGMALCYNKKLFQQAGLKPPDASWTWSNVITAAQKLTNPSKHVYGFVAPNDNELGWYLTVPSAGGYIISPDGKTSGYDQPGTVKGIEFLTDMINKYHVSPNLQQTTDTDPQAMLTSGKVAMRFCGSWEPEEIGAVPYGKTNIDFAPLPLGPNGNRDYYSNGLANVIAAKSKHPDQAWEFVKFLGSAQAAQIQAKTGTVIPAYKGQATAYAQAMPQYDMKVFLDALPNSKPYPASENTTAWQDYATQQFANAWTGKATVSDVAHQVATKMNQDLASEKH
jgi:multiple sugar transport system substrate-binding protein